MTLADLQAYMHTHYDGAEMVFDMAPWHPRVHIFENRHQRFITVQTDSEWQVYTYHETIEKKESGQ